MEYKKPPLTFQQQVQQLKDRGLIINDDAKAINLLRHVNYYRLSAYFLPFQSQTDVFDKETTIEKITNLYEFDRQLRGLIFEVLEEVEISVRTQVANCLSMRYGAFGYINGKNFAPFFKHTLWMQGVADNIKSSHEIFVKHFFGKYTSEKYLPVWMMSEAISFGQISKLFMGLKKHDRQAIAKEYKIDQRVLSSWLHTIVYIRNLCAHHSRIWNRKLAITPKVLHKSPSWKGISNTTLFSVFLILKTLTKTLNKWDEWSGKLLTLLGEFSNIDVHRMGFPRNWKDILFDSDQKA